jgi:aspartyl-tRNA(Asn)/glutamyl-tRNA(Gln) amidotransferase subunit C
MQVKEHPMTQYVSETDVRGIAEYARIGLTDDEVAQMTVDLNNVIETLKPITEFDLEGVEPSFHPIGDLSNVMREDVERPSFTQAEALSNAPRQQDGQFLIPSILGEGGDR